ncbi:MAG: acyltransferase [Chloracidobacterium sp.]|nr:acyltransferase [Chloracidobacterium sp.]
MKTHDASNARITRNENRFSGLWESEKHFATDLSAKLSLARIPALDGIRALAVFLVIFYHFGFNWAPGGAGVMMFFVLSGFLITWLLLKENERYGDISLKGFYRRRILRIFPAFYAYWIILICLLSLKGKNVLWPHAISALFYVSNYYNAILGDPNNGFSHTWSLGIEEQFYLLWPFAFFLLRDDLKKMTRFLVILIGAVWLHRLILYFIFGVNQAYFYASFDTRLDNLMVGCLAAVLLKRGALFSVWRVLCSNAFMVLLVVAPFLCSIYLGPLLMTRYLDVIGFAIDPILIALLMIQLISLSSSPCARWIESPLLRFLGRISYSLYLYQQITMDLAKKPVADQPVIIQLLVAVSFTVAVASFSYYVIERPFLRLRGSRPSRAVAAPAASV